MSIFVGVDPGKDGAIVLMDGGGTVMAASTMPVLKGKRPEFDLEAIDDVFAAWKTGIINGMVTLEKLQPLPPAMGGSIANFNRGVSCGFEWMCVAHGLPHLLVSPRIWQKEMLAGTPGDDTKQRSIMAAQRLFPGVDLKRTSKCKGPHDGICDALLIAEYGRRIKLGRTQ